MTGYEAYKIFLGINNHFFKPSYSYMKYGPVPVKPETFANKSGPDRFRFERLGKKFSDKETLENFLVANAIESRKKVWVGDLFGGEADERYKLWIGRMQSCQYTITGQVKSLVEAHGGFGTLFRTPTPGQHPEILKAYLRNDITIEGFVLLEMCVGFFQYLDKDLGEDRTWFVLRNKAFKYQPFINRLNISISKLSQSIMTMLHEMGVSG